MSSKTAVLENLYTTQHRWYLTPQCITKMFPEADASCWRCKPSRDFFFFVSDGLVQKSKVIGGLFIMVIGQIMGTDFEFSQIFLGNIF